MFLVVSARGGESNVWMRLTMVFKRAVIRVVFNECGVEVADKEWLCKTNECRPAQCAKYKRRNVGGYVGCLCRRR
jgi:hypothetical protein